MQKYINYIKYNNIKSSVTFDDFLKKNKKAFKKLENILTSKNKM